MVKNSLFKKSSLKNFYLLKNINKKLIKLNLKKFLSDKKIYKKICKLYNINKIKIHF